jgi:hypothetical protein
MGGFCCWTRSALRNVAERCTTKPAGAALPSARVGEGASVMLMQSWQDGHTLCWSWASDWSSLVTSSLASMGQSAGIALSAVDWADIWSCTICTAMLSAAHPRMGSKRIKRYRSMWRTTE